MDRKLKNAPDGFVDGDVSPEHISRNLVSFSSLLLYSNASLNRSPVDVIADVLNGRFYD